MAVSVDRQTDSQKTQSDYPGLRVVADENHALTEAAGLVDPKAGPDGGDIAVPATIIIGPDGTVFWVHRSSAIARLAPEAVLDRLDGLGLSK